MRTKRLVGFKHYIRKALSVMPDGWWAAFGEEMAKDLARAVRLDGGQDDFGIVQVKEKYGGLRVYVVGGGDNVNRIIEEYEAKSKRTCVKCGKPAKWISYGWICPYCDECAAAIHNLAYPIEQQED